MAKKLEKWKIIAANNVVLGVVQATSQLEAWQKLCTTLGISPEAKVTSLEPGLKFVALDDRDWKPTHTIIAGATKIDVCSEKAIGFENLLLLYTHEEWLNHDLNHWDLVDGKLLRRNGKESSATIVVKS